MLWDKRLVTQFGDTIEGLAPDGHGGFYVSGNTEGSLAGTNPTPVINDPFLARYDGNGNRLWVRQLNLPGQDFAGRVAADPLGGAFITGSVATALPGETSAGQLDAFIAYYNENGDLLWKDQFGSDKADNAYGIGADGLGSVYVGGYTWGNVFGANHGGASDPYDALLVRYSSTLPVPEPSVMLLTVPLLLLATRRRRIAKNPTVSPLFVSTAAGHILK